MSDLPAKHYLWIYQRRVSMAEDGTTHPTEAVVLAMKQLVNALSTLHPDTKVWLEARDGNARFKVADTDSLIAEFRFAAAGSGTGR